MAKARALTSDIEEAAAEQAIDMEAQQWDQLGAVEARYDPASLLRYIELTSSLRPCIDAMAHNTVGYGYQVRPLVEHPWLTDLDSEEARKAVRASLEIEAWVDLEEEALYAAQERQKLQEQIAALRKAGSSTENVQKQIDELDQEEAERDTASTVTDEQVDAAIDKLKRQQEREHLILEAFLRNCCSETSFTELRVKMVKDYESHGWGCYEVMRDTLNRIKRFGYVPAYEVRPLEGRGEVVDVIESDALTPLNPHRETSAARRFSVYVQIHGTKKIYFKEIGDPRVVSRKTGKVYKTIEDLRRPEDAKERKGEGPDAVAANELMWFAQHDPTSACPPPRWIGNLLNVLGSREADETNYNYLSDSAIPSGFLFLHGGTIRRDVRERMERKIRHAARGAAGSGKIITVEAIPGKSKEPGEKALMPKITWQSLRDAQQDDMTFIEYDKRTADRIGASFRISSILRGYIPPDLNRATATVALFLAEQQVFDPNRDIFDWKFNKFILSQLGIYLWQLKSNSPPTRSADEVGKFVQQVAPHGALIPEEIREMTSQVLNMPLRRIDAPWAKQQPMIMTLQGITEDGAGGTEGQQRIEEQLRQIQNNLGAQLNQMSRDAGLDYDFQIGMTDPRDIPLGNEEDDDE
jgi:capsid portal protein